MTDLDELERLAQAATPAAGSTWVADRFVLVIENGQAVRAFVATAKPQAVLELIALVRDLQTVLAELKRINCDWAACDDCASSAMCDVHEERYGIVETERDRLLRLGTGGHLANHLRQIRDAAERIESWSEETEELQDIIFSPMVEASK